MTEQHWPPDDPFDGAKKPSQFHEELQRQVAGQDYESSGKPDGARLLKNVGSGVFGNAVITRCLFIMGITVLMLLPLSYFSGLVDERAELYDEAIDNIAHLWGQSQVVSGPALVIPYVTRDAYDMDYESSPDHPGKNAPAVRRGRQYVVLLPETVHYDAELATETRYRGIYKYVVYSAPVSIRGAYRLPESGPLADNHNLFFWDQAYFCVGVSDLKAITSIGSLNWNGNPAEAFAPGMRGAELLGPGFQSRVALRPDQSRYEFSLDLKLNGSGGMYFTPVGETSTVAISGQWADPNFDGEVLPTTRSISPEGFSAEWTVPHLSRNYPQSGELGTYLASSREGAAISAFTAGVSLYETVPLYRKVTRAVKYGVLFIGLTFTALLSFELALQQRLHLVQYGMVGIAMCLFYLVLLSLAEHTALWRAFSLASGVSVLMNGLYIAAALRSKKRGLTIAVLLSSLYGVLYALLQLEGYAILVGTVLVVAVVAVLMYLTRNLGSPGDDGNIRE